VVMNCRMGSVHSGRKAGSTGVGGREMLELAAVLILSTVVRAVNSSIAGSGVGAKRGVPAGGMGAGGGISARTIP